MEFVGEMNQCKDDQEEVLYKGSRQRHWQHNSGSKEQQLHNGLQQQIGTRQPVINKYHYIQPQVSIW